MLVACEFSGRVRDAFLALGHDAVSCDIIPSETPGPHIVGDVRAHLADGWDLMVGFPPCTDLSCAGARAWPEKLADGRTAAAAAFVKALWEAPIPRIAVENPMGWLNTNWRKPDQTINPFQFGEPWKKRTCLWLRGLPKLTPTKLVEPIGYWVDGSAPHKRRLQYSGYRNPRVRSLTFPGIAQAMAGQWGGAV